MKTKPCYGKMYPDIESFDKAGDFQGKIFSVAINIQPISVREKIIDIDEEQWLQCIVCDQYRSCYDFSTAKWNFGTKLSSL